MDLYAADGSPNSLPRLRLRSMYAEKPEDCLLFQVRCGAALCVISQCTRIVRRKCVLVATHILRAWCTASANP